MNGKRWILILMSAYLVGTQGALADDDGWREWLPGNRRASVDVTPVVDMRYAEECGACHFAYPPGLLPARSWRKLMASLSNHFGENAELPADTVKSLTSYVITNAADRARGRRSQKIVDSLRNNESPLRITETPYVKREHAEIPARLIGKNPEVRSLSNCDACHTRAGQGSFREREINIPGYGQWED